MNITAFFSLLGGLALFLYGMHIMSQGLENAAGSRLQSILEKLTENRLVGVAAGALITALIQSSSATTVMVVGFVNSGMMRLEQAVWIIMGANIGTTITGQLIALNIGAVAPVIAFAGVVVVLFAKKAASRYIGSIFGGLGILFIGMNMMSDALMPLKDSPAFIQWMTKFENPLLGILIGTVFTAVIQSSSASVGVLQALAVTGAVPFSSAVYVLFGQNIGTCITAVLASVGANRNAKRTTIIHLSFNIIGTCLFTAVCMLTPLAELVGSFTPDRPAAQIANMHTLFNIVTTLLLLPAGGLLAKFAKMVLPDKARSHTGTDGRGIQGLLHTRDGQIGTAAMQYEGLKQDIQTMCQLAAQNVSTAMQAFRQSDPSRLPQLEEREEQIDIRNHQLSDAIAQIMAGEMNETESRHLAALYRITGDIERIGDHAVNICEYSKRLSEKKIVFSKEAMGELEQMQSVLAEILSTISLTGENLAERSGELKQLEKKTDAMTEEYRDAMMHRIKEGSCSSEGSILYSEMLTDFERIGDHAWNIGKELRFI